MKKEEFTEILKIDKEIIDKRIEKFFLASENILDQAVYYAIDGGKRIRPIIFLETIKMFKKGEFDEIDLDLAISIEMIHAYSLIHDDMPCMDNDDFRRGKETVHKKFGEDMALLAGDYLLNTAYENILRLSCENENYARAGFYIAKQAGRRGMIEGQYYDIYKKETYDLSYVLDVYKKKTAALFKASLVGAGLSLGLGEKEISMLESYGLYLGLSFQLQDDLLDMEDETELNILKTINEEEAQNYLHKFNQRAKKAVEKFENNDFHIFLIDYLSKRTI